MEMVNDGMYERPRLNASEPVAVLSAYKEDFDMSHFPDDVLDALNSIISSPPRAALRSPRIRAVGWTRYLSAPRYALVVLRELAVRGRALRGRVVFGKKLTVRDKRLLDFLFPGDQPKKRARRHSRLPDDLFPLVARYYWGGDLPAEEEGVGTTYYEDPVVAEYYEDPVAEYYEDPGGAEYYEDPVVAFRIIDRSLCLTFGSVGGAFEWTVNMNYGVFAGEGATFCPMQNCGYRVRIPENLHHLVCYLEDGRLESDGNGGVRLKPEHDTYGRYEQGFGRESDGRELLSVWVERVCQRLRGDLIYRTGGDSDC